jgi:hypothetical protein
MSENIRSEMISRRDAFSLLGLAAALSLVVPAAVMTATEAEARVGNPGSAVSVAGANRRDRRQDRRYKKKKKKPTDTEQKKGLPNGGPLSHRVSLRNVRLWHLADMS